MGRSIGLAIDDDKSDFFTSPLPTPREDVQGAAGTLADTTGRDPSPRPYQSAQFDKEGEEATEALASLIVRVVVCIVEDDLGRRTSIQ